MNFQLDPKTAQLLVDAILEGNQSYDQERRQKKTEMAVSAANAFTRGNHIDSVLHSRVKQHPQINAQTQHAGHFWEYIALSLNYESKKYLIITKHRSSVNRSLTKARTSSAQDSYLVQLARQINTPWISELSNQYSRAEQMTLGLFPEENVTASNNYDGFFLLIYDTDTKTHIVHSISLMALHPDTRILHKIQDLSSYISASSIQQVEMTDSFVDELEGAFDTVTFPYGQPGSAEVSGNE